MSPSNQPKSQKRAVPSPRAPKPPSLRWNLSPLALGIVLAVSGLLGATWNNNTLLWNAYSHLVPTKNSEVVLVNIDAGSIADYGEPHTWPRALYGEALEELQTAGAKAIGIDINFSESKPGDIELARYFSSPQVVLAAPPEAKQGNAGTQANWTSPQGVSALRRGVGGGVYEYQTGYRGSEGQILPSFSWELAQAAGYSPPLDTQARPLLHLHPTVAGGSLSFRDVVQGQFRYADVQDKIVIIGTASGNIGYIAETFGQVGSEGQVRAVASLAQGLPTTLPVWLTALLSALLAGGLYALGRQWAFAVAAVMLPLGLLAWKFGLALPTLTFFAVSLAIALVSALAQAHIERRNAALVNSLNNRAALTRTLEDLQASSIHNVALALIYLPGYTTVLEQAGEVAAEQAFCKVLENTGALGASYPEASGVGFRWGPEELVMLIEPVPDNTTAREVEQLLLTSSDVVVDGVSLRPAVAAMCLQTLPDQPAAPGELIERLRFQLLSQGFAAEADQ